MDSENTNVLDWALRYAHIGWKIFPVSYNKRPITKNGFKDASSDPKQIRRWFRQHPAAGVGVATGEASGIVVLDVDLQKEDAEINLRRVVQAQGTFAQDVVSKTGGGGLHFFFRYPGVKVPNAQRLLGFSGLDVRGDGGYVVLPPSRHATGNLYLWGHNQEPFDQDLPDCPEFLYATSQGVTPGSQGFQFSGNIPEGERNGTLASIAGLLRSLGLDEEGIYNVLAQQNESRCVPPLPEAEVRQISRHIAKYPPKPNNGISEHIGLENLLEHPWTDTGFANMIEMLNAGRMKYNHTTGRWHLWDTHYWKIDDVEEIVVRAIDTAKQFEEATDLIDDDDRKNRARRFANQMQNRARLESAIRLARTFPGIASAHREWDAQPHLVAAENGVIDLKTGVIRPGDPNDMISSKLSIDFDPHAKCPIWDKFLREIFQGDESVIDFVHKAVGYTLTGSTEEQCVFLLVGRGSNGKSTFLEALYQIFGTYSYSAPFETFERKPVSSSLSNDVAAMANKRFVMASEPSEGTVLNDGRIKSMTGGETITARFLHQEFFEFRPKFKIWLGVNHLPRVQDDSEGFWRRVRKIDFPVRFVSKENAGPGDSIKDISLAAKLKKEYPGILNWAVQGAVKWYREGLTVPESITASTADYRRDSDPLDEFIRSCCIQGSQFQIQVDELFKAYVADSQDRMLKNYEILSATRFHTRIRARVQRMDIDRESYYIGIDINDRTRSKMQAAAPPKISLKYTARPEQAVQ